MVEDTKGRLSFRSPGIRQGSVFLMHVLKRLGIACKRLYRRTLTAPKLARAIHSVLESSELAGRVKDAGKKMAQENGRKRAVELIEERFKKASGLSRK
jgi:UDP:flavonoid glycosyltransferase YjiC (YdhE family)